MKYSPVLIVHICAGIIGVLSGSIALVVRKGSRLHRRAGVVFAVSMMSMAAAGAYVALTKSQPTNVIAGTFTFYLVATAWMTVTRKERETGGIEWGLVFLGLAAGISSLILGSQEAQSARGARTGESIMLYVFGAVALLSVAGDLRMLIRGGVAGAKRLTRHLWRMGVALFIAAGSFFLGTASDPVLRKTGLRTQLFSPAIRKTHLPEVPVLIIVILIVFWLCRVMFTKAYKSPSTKLDSSSPSELVGRTMPGLKGIPHRQIRTN